MSATPPPNSVEIEAKRLLRDLSHCPETAKEPLIWNALNSQRRSALEEAVRAAEEGSENHAACFRAIAAIRSLLEVKG